MELSEEEKEELSVGLLREWWITTTQALVDVAGTDEALRRLKPYFLHSGKAAIRVLSSIPGLSFPNVEISIDNAAYAIAIALGGQFLPAYAADDRSYIGEIRNCATRGACKEACISFCSFTAASGTQELYPDYDNVLISSLSNGDPCCQWLLSKKGRKAKVVPTDFFRIPREQVYCDPFDEDTKKYLGLAYCGEIWVLATRAIIDFGGSEAALNILRPRMFHSGISLGNKFSNRLNAHVGKMGSILDLLYIIQHLHQQKGTSSTGSEMAQGTVDECPFASSAPPEICLQYEAFFNGICEVIDSSYEFAYDRMMTKGDKTCHWTIKKKGELVKEKLKEEAPSDDPVKMLAMRFAKGEITEEELEKKVAHLRKLGLLK